MENTHKTVIAMDCPATKSLTGAPHKRRLKEQVRPETPVFEQAYSIIKRWDCNPGARACFVRFARGIVEKAKSKRGFEGGRCQWTGGAAPEMPHFEMLPKVPP
jgi:hypothetical protein